jgi:hypothetical protein
MDWFKNLFSKKTKLEQLVAKNQKLGRKTDKIRQQRIELNKQIRKELGEE